MSHPLAGKPAVTRRTPARKPRPADQLDSPSEASLTPTRVPRVVRPGALSVTRPPAQSAATDPAASPDPAATTGSGTARPAKVPVAYRVTKTRRALRITDLPDADRQVRDDTDATIKSLPDSAHAQQVGRLLTAELQNLGRRRAMMTADEWATAIRDLSVRVWAIKQVLPDVEKLIGVRPLERADLLARLTAVRGPRGVARLLQTLDQMRDDAIEPCRQAVTRIQNLSVEQIAMLPVGDTVDLLAALRAGERFTPEVERQKALVKLYLDLPLDPAFMQLDDQLRSAYRAKIKIGLQDYEATWADRPPSERLDALNQALTLQSETLEMPVEQRAKIAVVPDLRRTLPNGSTVTLTGAYDHGSRTLQVTSAAIDIFDNALDTVLHENTHVYQRLLVAKLDREEITAGDPQFHQVVLFALNQGSGYYKGGTSYLPTGDDEMAYMNQPTERHAWRAGLEARAVFKAEARDQVLDLKRQIDAWVQANPSRAMLQRVQDQSTRLQQAAVNPTTTKAGFIALAAQVSQEFSTLSKPPPPVAQPPATQPGDLATAMSAWLKANSSSQLAKLVESLLEDVARAGSNHRKLRSLKESFDLAIADE